MEDLAQKLYEAYCEHTGWKSIVTGSDLPKWNDLDRKIQDAWRAVEKAVNDNE